jgi:hypothetical protein
MLYGITNVYIVDHCVDLRKSFDGLLSEAILLDVDVFNASAVVFVSRNKRLLKILWADKTGLRLSMKRFHKECARTKVRFLEDRCCREISNAELQLLIEGKEYEIKKATREWSPKKTSPDG